MDFSPKMFQLQNIIGISDLFLDVNLYQSWHFNWSDYSETKIWTSPDVCTFPTFKPIEWFILALRWSSTYLIYSRHCSPSALWSLSHEPSSVTAHLGLPATKPLHMVCHLPRRFFLTTTTYIRSPFFPSYLVQTFRLCKKMYLSSFITMLHALTCSQRIMLFNN